MSTTGCRVGTRSTSQPSSRSAAAAAAARSRGHAFAVEDEGAHRLVDRGEIAVEELLGLVRLGRDPGAFAQLQHRLVRGRSSRPAPATTNRSSSPTSGSGAASASSTAPGSQEMSSPCSAAIAATAHV